MPRETSLEPLALATLLRIYAMPSSRRTVAAVRLDLVKLLSDSATARHRATVEGVIAAAIAEGRVRFAEPVAGSRAPRLEITPDGEATLAARLGEMPGSSTFTKLRNGALAKTLAAANRGRRLDDFRLFRAALIARHLGLDDLVAGAIGPDDILNLVAAKITGARSATAKAIRNAAFRSALADDTLAEYAGFDARALKAPTRTRSPQPKKGPKVAGRGKPVVATPDGPSRLTSPSEVTMPLERFASIVRDIAERTPGARGRKIFISYVWAAVRESRAFPDLDERAFKQRLVDAARKGFVNLSRVDLPQEFAHADIEASVTDLIGEPVHFIEVSRR